MMAASVPAWGFLPWVPVLTSLSDEQYETIRSSSHCFWLWSFFTAIENTLAQSRASDTKWFLWVPEARTDAARGPFLVYRHHLPAVPLHVNVRKKLGAPDLLRLAPPPSNAITLGLKLHCMNWRRRGPLNPERPKVLSIIRHCSHFGLQFK